MIEPKHSIQSLIKQLTDLLTNIVRAAKLVLSQLSLSPVVPSALLQPAAKKAS